MSFQKYECIICMELCQKPISCLQCSKLICMHHTRRINNRCPNCRLEPYRFKDEADLGREIDLMRKKQMQKMKKQNVFKCLVKGCQFEGKYHSMVVHRKSKHYDERIDEMIFPEERKKKFRRDALKKLFFFFDEDQKLDAKYHEKAVQIYARTKGRCELPDLKKLLIHIEQCNSPECKEVEIGQEYVYIGQAIKGQDGKLFQSMCSKAKNLKTKLE